MIKKDESSGRLDWIDLAKFLAILIVLMNHAGLQVPLVNFWGGMFYVPLFFVLSGFLWRPKEESYRSFVRKKARRLLLPFLLTNLILVGIYLAADVIRGTYADTLLRSVGFVYGRNQLYSARDTLFPGVLGKNIYFMTALNAPTWFLPALFLTVIFMEALFRLANRKKKTDDLFALLVVSIDALLAVLWSYLTPVLLPWSLEALPFFMMFFLLGFILSRQGGWDYLVKRPVNFVVMFVILFVGGTLNGSSNFSVGEYGQSVMLANLNALLASVLIMFICYMLRGHVPGILSCAGQKTLPLLCWHFPILTAMELVRTKLFPSMGEIAADVLKAAEIAVTICVICFADSLLHNFLERKKKTIQETGTEVQ